MVGLGPVHWGLTDLDFDPWPNDPFVWPGPRFEAMAMLGQGPRPRRQREELARSRCLEGESLTDRMTLVHFAKGC